MTKMLPIAITILHYKDAFLWLKRKNPPYENLWCLVGGKIKIGEHIPSAAIREVMEETSATRVSNYLLKGVVSELLIEPDNELTGHFLIFVGSAEIDTFEANHREGVIERFTMKEIIDMKESIIASDFEMFMRFVESSPTSLQYHEVELVQEKSSYHLNYYRDVSSASQ